MCWNQFPEKWEVVNNNIATILGNLGLESLIQYIWLEVSANIDSYTKSQKY